MNKKLFFTLALVGAFVTAQPSLCATDVFPSDPGVATWNSITGGNIVSDGTTCEVRVNPGAAGATANWNTLSVPATKTLNFYFPDGGQYALNKVMFGTSHIAGNVGYAAGSQNGTVIISNPNGILCSGSSVINMGGSLLLTTHDANFAEEGILNLTRAADWETKYNGVTVIPGAQITLGGNLTIASLGIDINGANITSNDAILITSDGLNYVLAEKPTAEKTANPTTLATQPSKIYYNSNYEDLDELVPDAAKTKVANTAFKTVDGKIIIKSNAGNVDIASSKIDGKTDLIAANNVNVESSSTIYGGNVVDQTKGAFLDDVNITAGNNVTLTAVSQETTVPVYKDLTVNAGGDVTMKNVKMMNGAAYTADLTANNVNITNYDTTSIDQSKTVMGNLEVNAANDFTLTQTLVLGDSNITAGNDIKALGSLLGEEGKTTNLTAKNIIIDESPMSDTAVYIAMTLGTLNATATESIKLANNYLDPDASADLILNAPSITMDNFSGKSGDFQNVENLNISESEIFGDLDITGKKDGSDNLITNAVIDDLTVGGDLTTNDIDSLALTNSTVDGDYNANNVNNLNMDQDTINGNIILDEIDTVVMDNVAGNDSLDISNVDNWTMDNSTIANNVTTNAIGNYSSNTNNNTFNGGESYTYTAPVPAPSTLNLEDGENVVKAYVDTLDIGNAPSANVGGGEFTARAFAAGEDDDDDYKEEFMRQYVKEDKDGNLYTIDTFKGE